MLLKAVSLAPKYTIVMSEGLPIQLTFSDGKGPLCNTPTLTHCPLLWQTQTPTYTAMKDMVFRQSLHVSK